MKSLQQILALATTQRDHPWALATLVWTEGSTYRKHGARLLIHPDGTSIGVLSGGCLEEEVARHGVTVLEQGVPQLLEFDTRRLYGCSGKLGIFIERIPAAGEDGNFLTTIAHLLDQRATCRVKTEFLGAAGGSQILPEHALVVERPGSLIQTIPLPVRLLVFGSGPEIAPLRVFSAALGWIFVHHPHPDGLAEDFTPDHQTAAVVMTHHFGRDLAALDRLLPRKLRYLALLGPKRRQSELLGRMQDYRDVDPNWLDSLHSPAGLDIGSEAPEEIALSIVAEAAAVLSGRSGGKLLDSVRALTTPEPLNKEA
jgi:xanthine dehydrogenase accessory factor